MILLCLTYWIYSKPSFGFYLLILQWSKNTAIFCKTFKNVLFKLSVVLHKFLNFKGFTRDKSNRRFIFNRFLWSVQWKISESVQCKNFFSTNSIGQSSGRFLGQSNEQICPVEDQEGSFPWKSLSPEWLP